jgi:hypothetical protein
MPGAPGSLGDGMGKVAEQIGLFRTIAQHQAQTLAENTQALLRSTALQTTGGAAYTAGSIAGTAARALSGGLGLSSLASSIVRLFRGDRQETGAALATYSAPDPIHFEGAAPATAGMPILPIDYGQDGLPRRDWTTAYRATGGTGDRPPGAARPGAPVHAPAVTVQVQAMDSRSFLDHSSEIARAVREALLNADALGGAISEL